MKLDYKFYDNFYGVDMHQREYLKASYVKNSIETRQTKLREKEDAIANLQYERDLIVDNLVNITKEDLQYSAFNIFRFYNPDFYYKVWTHSRFLNSNKADFYKDCDEDTKQTNKTCYECALELIKNNLIPEEYVNRISFAEVIRCSYVGTYDFIMLLDNDRTLSIVIPDFNLANKDNYVNIILGYTLREHLDHEITSEFHELDPREFKTKFKEWLDKQSNKDE